MGPGIKLFCEQNAWIEFRVNSGGEFRGDTLLNYSLKTALVYLVKSMAVFMSIFQTKRINIISKFSDD